MLRIAAVCAPASCCARVGHSVQGLSRTRQKPGQAAAWVTEPDLLANREDASRSVELLAFTLIVDDIILPDGSSCMEQLGGGGPQTLWGFQLQRHQQGGARVALAAGVGADVPARCLDWLRGSRIDTGALLRFSRRTPRAWQVCEYDGRRHEIWRTPYDDGMTAMLRPALAQLPPEYQVACNFHIGVHPDDPSLALLKGLRAAAGDPGLVSAEPFAAASARLAPAALSAFMSLLDVFSPNEAEAVSMLMGPQAAGGATAGSSGGGGPADPRRLTEPFLEAGARLMALRCGERGAVVQDAAKGEAWHVPAYPDTSLVDATGCGNAFCGAFLAALLAGEGAVAAAAWGCAAGSVMAECRGWPLPPPALAGCASDRQAILLDLAKRV